MSFCPFISMNMFIVRYSWFMKRENEYYKAHLHRFLNTDYPNVSDGPTEFTILLVS